MLSDGSSSSEEDISPIGLGLHPSTSLSYLFKYLINSCRLVSSEECHMSLMVYSSFHNVMSSYFSNICVFLPVKYIYPISKNQKKLNF